MRLRDGPPLCRHPVRQILKVHLPQGRMRRLSSVTVCYSSRLPLSGCSYLISCHGWTGATPFHPFHEAAAPEPVAEKPCGLVVKGDDLAPQKNLRKEWRVLTRLRGALNIKPLNNPKRGRNYHGIPSGEIQIRDTNAATSPVKSVGQVIGMVDGTEPVRMLAASTHPDGPQRAISRDYWQLWKDITDTFDEAKAVRILVNILDDKEGRTFVSCLERKDAELCIEILGHVSRGLHLVRPFLSGDLCRALRYTTSRPQRSRFFSSRWGGSLDIMGDCQMP